MDRAMALEALESMLVGLSNGDTASNRLLSADALWCLPDCLRTRSAYDRRRAIRTGGGSPFEPGSRQPLHLDAGLICAPAEKVFEVRVAGLRLLQRVTGMLKHLSRMVS